MREITEENDTHGEYLNNKVNVRIIGAKRRTKMANIKANMIGKFIQVRGTVIRISNIQPFVTIMPFRCGSCGETIEVPIVDGKHQRPKKCTTQGCRSKTFEPIKSDAQTIDLQYVKLDIRKFRFLCVLI